MVILKNSHARSYLNQKPKINERLAHGSKFVGEKLQTRSENHDKMVFCNIGWKGKTFELLGKYVLVEFLETWVNSPIIWLFFRRSIVPFVRAMKKLKIWYKVISFENKRRFKNLSTVCFSFTKLKAATNTVFIDFELDVVFHRIFILWRKIDKWSIYFRWMKKMFIGYVGAKRFLIGYN